MANNGLSTPGPADFLGNYFKFWGRVTDFAPAAACFLPACQQPAYIWWEPARSSWQCKVGQAPAWRPPTGAGSGAGVWRRDGAELTFILIKEPRIPDLSRQRAGLPRHLLGRGLYFSFGPMLGMNPTMPLSLHRYRDDHIGIYLHATDTIPLEDQPPRHHSHLSSYATNTFGRCLPRQPCSGFWTTHMVNKTMMVSALAGEPDTGCEN